MNIQNEFSKINGKNFILPSAECKGPLLIDRDGITIEGNGGTLWAKKGPVLKILANDVTIKNIRLDVIDSEEFVLADCGKNTKFINVEVYGQIEGEEESGWEIPKQIDLGHFAAEAENRFYVHLSVPQETQIISHIEGINIFPAHVQQGDNEIMIVSAKLFKGTIIYGDLLISSKGIIRCIKVTGEVEEGAPIRQDIPSVRNIKKSKISENKTSSKNTITEDISLSDSVVIRGQRLSIPDKTKLYIKYMDKGHTRGADIDFYVFILGRDGKTHGDEDFIFFGNTVSKDKAVQLQQDGSLILLPARIIAERLIICCAIYEESHVSFAQVQSPSIEVKLDDKKYVFKLDGLKRETTVDALEVYRHKGMWKIKFVGAGYTAGLRRLCEEYGLTVEA